MADILNIPPNLPKSQNAEVGASKFCPGCGHGITLKSLANAIDELGIKQTSDDGAIRDIVKGILDNNAKLIEEYRNGRSNVLDFFVGQVMKATRGQANPMMTTTIIKEEIDKR